jgi:hypothetical protein
MATGLHSSSTGGIVQCRGKREWENLTRSTPVNNCVDFPFEVENDSGDSIGVPNGMAEWGRDHNHPASSRNAIQPPPNQYQRIFQPRAATISAKWGVVDTYQGRRPSKSRKLSSKNTSPVRHLPGLPSPASSSTITRPLSKERSRRAGIWKDPNALLSTINGSHSASTSVLPNSASGKTTNLPLGLHDYSIFQGNVSSFTYLDQPFVAPYPTSQVSNALPDLDITLGTAPDSQCGTMDKTSVSESDWADLIDMLATDDFHSVDLREDPKMYEDELLAMMLQEQFEEEGVERRLKLQQVEENMMCTTHCGRAYLFVERVLAGLEEILGPSWNHKDSKSIETAQIRAVATDAMVGFALRLLEKQEEFRKAGKPVVVDLGYHYTEQSNMENIRTGGLMTRTERENQHITVARINGSFFGNGVYTGNNPTAFTRYGSVGLLVARLQGRSRRHSKPTFGPLVADPTVDTVVGNKGFSTYFDEVVLADSSQCLPIVEFPTLLIRQSLRSNNSDNPMAKIHTKIQQLVDEFFNVRLSTHITRGIAAIHSTIL